jgi:ribosomal protein S18 acetylase RimI-like enzyme
MGSLRLAPFDESCVEAAAVLLAARHQRARQHEPALPGCFTDPARAQLAVLAAVREPASSGVAALRDGQLVGFLIGVPELTEIWGRSVWVRYGWHALAADEDAEVYRDLYAAAAPQWLARGCFAHYVELSGDDPASLDAWFRLSFGLQHAYGIRRLSSADLAAPVPEAAVTIRRAGPDDSASLAELEGILWTHLGRSPVYSVRLPEHAEHSQEAAAETLADPQVAVWLAERDGKVLGAATITPLTPADDLLDVPEHCCFLAFAATRVEERGHGIGTALTARALHEAQAAGYTCSLTDWRVTSLQASRLWPRLGFRPFQYRLHRLLDPRIAWAPTFPQ